ncbi:PAX-interacting protein 1-like [Melanaphis sacchari]|nr:PAX-interacting protein 1-like [Melanaphis sacchari]
MEHGGTVANHYSNKVTHLICNSQKNNEVVRGLSDHKKCVTDYWLSDIISEKKIIKPWLSHHLPIPYSYDNLPCEDNQIAIVNFNKNEYFKAKVMAEILGACVTSNVSNSTHIVISQNLEGGIIRRALTLEIPIVNVLWIIDLFLGEKIGFHDSNKTKYQQYELSDPFSINSVRVSHLMEAWKDCSSNHIKFVSNKVANMPTSAKRMKTCFIHDFSKSGNNNDESESNVTSAITIPMENDNTSSRYSTD